MRTITYLAFLGTTFLAGCSNTGSTTSAARPTSADVERDIRSRLSAEPDLQAANLSVEVDRDKNEVKLSGSVPSETLRTKAVEIAKTAQPDAVVKDTIDVKAREVSRSEYTEDMAKTEREQSAGDKIGTSLDDAWIHSKITAKLIANSATPARKINVDVNAGMVILRGTVESAAAKEEANRIAKDTDGVKRVSNLLQVKAG